MDVVNMWAVGMIEEDAEDGMETAEERIGVGYIKKDGKYGAANEEVRE